MPAETYVPEGKMRFWRTPSGLRHIPDLRVRCRYDDKVVLTQEKAEFSARKACERGQPMKAYLGKCGHWHTARIKK